jgi:glutathione peroxidase
MHKRHAMRSAILILLGVTMNSLFATEIGPTSVLDFTMKNIDGKEIPLSSYKGKVLLFVNVASKCGNTPQYKGLEELYNRYKEKGLMILGFPANNFKAQEPGTDAEIKTFCETNYGVTFDMFSKISVKGDDQHPLYKFLTSADTDPEYSGDVRWNFQKYLVNREGKIVGKFDPKLTPLDDVLIQAIEKALQAP